MLEGQRFNPARPLAPSPYRGVARKHPADATHVAERRQQRLLRLLAQFERSDIEATVDRLIAMLDRQDDDADREEGSDIELNGDEADTAVVDFDPRDPAYRAEMVAAGAALEDAEANGDEQDHCGAEDDFVRHHSDGRPGCPIADPDHGAEEVAMSGGGDPSWTEWHTRRGPKLASHGAEPTGGDHEDAEDDDPAEDADNDRCAAGEDHLIAGPFISRHLWERDTWAIGSDDDAEYGHRGHRRPTYGPDQRRPIEATPNTPAAMFT